MGNEIDLDKLEEAINFQSAEEFTEQDMVDFDWTNEMVIAAARKYLTQQRAMLPQEKIRQALTWIDTDPNAPKHFTKHGNEVNRATIRTVLENALQEGK